MVNNLTGLQNITKVHEVITYANVVSGSVMGTFFSLALFFIILLGFVRRFDFFKSLMISSFITLMVCLPLYAYGLISGYFMLIYIFVLAVSAAMRFK